MYIIISLFWILSISALLVMLFNKKFNQVLPLSFIFGIFILYIGGFLKLIHQAYYLTLIIGILTTLFLIYRLIKKDTVFINKFKDNYFVLSLPIFIIVFVLINIVYKEAFYNHWDEFVHWGPMVRETVNLNTYYAIPEANLHLHKDYPPFFALLGTLFCHFKNISYQENRLYIAWLTFMFSLLLSSLSSNSFKDKKNYLLSLISVIMIILVGFTIQSNFVQRIYNSVYSDWCLGLFTAYSYFVIVNDDEKDLFRYINIGFNAWVLLSMKQMGIAFCVLGLALLIVKEIIDRKISKNIIPVLLVCILPFIGYFIWNRYIAYTGALEIAQFKFSQIKLSELVDIAKGISGEQWQIDAYQSFMRALGISFIIKPIKLTYFALAIILSLIIALIAYLFKRKDMYFASIIYLGGSLAYAFSLLLLYVFSFGVVEGPMLASYHRYMYTYIFFGICFVVMFLIHNIKDIKYMLIPLACLLIFTDYSIISDLKIRKLEESVYFDEYPTKLSIETKDIKTLFIEQYSEIDHLYPVMDYHDVFVDGSKLIRVGVRDWLTTLSVELTYDEWIEMLKDYDYLYIVLADDYFLNNYFYPLTDIDFLNKALYKINKTNTGVDLEFVKIID